MLFNYLRTLVIPPHCAPRIASAYRDTELFTLPCLRYIRAGINKKLWGHKQRRLIQIPISNTAETLKCSIINYPVFKLEKYHVPSNRNSFHFSRETDTPLKNIRTAFGLIPKTDKSFPEHTEATNGRHFSNELHLSSGGLWTALNPCSLAVLERQE
jgi:hypothetical protein